MGLVAVGCLKSFYFHMNHTILDIIEKVPLIMWLYV